MKAWEVRSGEVGLHDVAPPRPNDGETVVRVSHTGICGSDLPKLLRPNGFTLPEPWRGGHEIAGTNTIGRTVAVDPLVPCRDCSRCAAGDTHLCPALRRLGWDLPGGFTEQVMVPAANAHPLPDGLDPLHAVLADPAAVAIHGLRCAPVVASGRLAVVGAGTVGLLTALYAHQQGWEVTVVHHDRRAPRPAVVDAVSATFRSPSNLSKQDAFEVVVDAASGDDPAPLELALRLVGDGGTIIVQNAYHPGVHLPTPLRGLFRRSIRLIGSFSYCRRQRPDDFAMALDLLCAQANQVVHLIVEGGDLADLAAVVSSRSARSVRRVLTVRHS